MTGPIIRAAAAQDEDAIWSILEPIIRGGETYALPRDMDRSEALTYWFAAGHEVGVALIADEIVGSYYLRPNQLGGGAHVANAAFIVAPATEGRGAARAMAGAATTQARLRGFSAMQFNFVVASNVRAIALWTDLGFRIIGTIPDGFHHPRYGLVDAHIMHRRLPEARR